ncbi:MAG: bifunctional aspartokinase / homoserine dehydrogenase 1, partial [Acidobacteriota bacterium]|nr:bifunctional aspartokinase / homoserine dehydrogenase 1 [Acidobacteriota bacterium]
MKKIVVKFGGSNLKQKEDFAKLIRVITLYRQPIIIVISALYGVTNILADAIRTVKTNEKAIRDLLQNLQDAHYRVIDLYSGTNNAEKAQEAKQKIAERLEELGKYLLGIHYLGEIPDFVEDRVLSYGERLSSLVLTSILDFNQIPCRECLP